MKYTTLFSYYFNDNKPLNEMILFEKKIILTSKTKSFYDLTEKNKEYKNEFIELAKRFFNYDEEETIGISGAIGSDAVQSGHCIYTVFHSKDHLPACELQLFRTRSKFLSSHGDARWRIDVRHLCHPRNQHPLHCANAPALA